MCLPRCTFSLFSKPMFSECLTNTRKVLRTSPPRTQPGSRGVHRAHRLPVRRRAAGEAGPRCSEPMASSPPAMRTRTAPWLRSYRSGCASRKACCSRLPQRRHAVDVVVAVALDMRDAQQRHQRQILLQRQPGLDRQVFGAHEVALGAGLGIPLAQRARFRSDLYRPLQVFDDTPRVASARGRARRRRASRRTRRGSPASATPAR